MENTIKGGDAMVYESRFMIVVGNPKSKKSFGKIMKCIRSCKNQLHIQSCAKMIRNSIIEEKLKTNLVTEIYHKSYELREASENK